MLPDMIPIRQHAAGDGLADVVQSLREALAALRLGERISPGQTVGFPVGSRGIRRLPELVRVTVGHLRELGAVPVVVAAMGSHGAGTVEGQMRVLHSLGVTEETVGAPVVAGVETVVVTHTADGHSLHVDRVLAGCDWILLLNRVKPHTSFHGPLESGLVKMLVVGCGKAAGARQFHQWGPGQLSARLRECGQDLLHRLPVLGGIAVLENGREEIAAIEPVGPEGFIQREVELLERARALLPRLPADELDLLVVDQMGKNFAGTGMDTNLIGRVGIRGVPDRGPAISRIVVLDLSDASHGNANGMGLADLVTRRLAQKVDFEATYLNTLTATFLERAKLPMVMESDRAAVEAALESLGRPSAPRIIRIRNTLEVEEMLVSSAVASALPGRDNFDVVGGPRPWPFDTNGNLL